MFLVIVNDIFVVDSADCRVDQHDINIVMMLRLFLGPDSLERLALHPASTGPDFSQWRVTPSLVDVVLVTRHQKRSRLLRWRTSCGKRQPKLGVALAFA